MTDTTRDPNEAALDPKLPEPTPDMLDDTPANKAAWLRAFGLAVATDGADRQRIEAIARSLASLPPAQGEPVATAPEVNRDNRHAILDAYQKLPPPSEAMIAMGAYILSEIIDDAAPMNERRYRFPAEAMLKFAALYASPPSPAVTALREALSTCARILDEMYKLGIVYTPATPADKFEGVVGTPYYIGEGVMPMIRAALSHTTGEGNPASTVPAK